MCVCVCLGLELSSCKSEGGDPEGAWKKRPPPIRKGEVEADGVFAERAKLGQAKVLNSRFRKLIEWA